MQNELGYSYKRGASRSFFSKNPKLVYLQAVFAARMLSWINNSKVIINVDESSYTKSTKIDYSWFPEERVTQLLTHIEKQAWTEYLPLQPRTMDCFVKQ